MTPKPGRKPPPVRLDRKSYTKLHNEILQRDNWRCQACGSMQNLQVHHLRFRSRSGDDIEENLITLCFMCHAAVHGGSYKTRIASPNQPES
jgi:5-methylcytosine-specific restriction endonuclease McrA